LTDGLAYVQFVTGGGDKRLGYTTVPINLFREQGAFEPEATAAMGEAFETACEELCNVDQLEMVRKLVAQRIVAAARKGNLDPACLRAEALSGLPVVKMAPAA